MALEENNHGDRKGGPGGPLKRQDILPSAFEPTMYIQFSLIISFVVINSRAMGSTPMNHGEAHIEIDSAKG
jgi:hypothetical protein